MLKKDYELRRAYLGMTNKEVAEACGLTANKLSMAISGLERTNSVMDNQSKINSYTAKCVNERRAAVVKELEDGGMQGDIFVVTPADNRHVVFCDGEFVGFYVPGSGKIAKI